MAQLDQSYTPPGVYTTTEYIASNATVLASGRIPVLIGEAPESFTTSAELHRGSSAVADDQVVGENISDQVSGGSRTFQLSYFPVVTGDGSGTVTNDPSKITAYTTGGVPISVVSLVGKTGVFQTQSIIPQGTSLSANYFFKKVDTHILAEDVTAQVPTFASLAVIPQFTLGTTIPGALGNNVTFTLTQASSGNGVSDAAAITGAGTDDISIELLNPENTVRTYDQLAALIESGIPTVSGGILTLVTFLAQNPTSPVPFATASFTGGGGQSTNTTFKVTYVPIVDGSNGGVVSTTPTDITVRVNDKQVKVVSIDGANGLFTLATGVSPTSSINLDYYTNRYQDTSDTLPSANVASVSSVGFSSGKSSFIQGVDYVLNGNSIAWGASVSTAAAVSTADYTPLDATVISTTLVDEKVYLVPLSGVVSGRNSTFTLQDTPVDGSGLARATDDISKIAIYVGPDPVSAFTSGAVRLARLSGASSQVTLYNPPAAGQNVYGSYYRSTLNDHAFTVSVAEPGIPAQGTFRIADELGAILPVATVGATSVTDANFANTGIVWPNNFSDLTAGIGAADETVTLTFQNDGLTIPLTQAIQASLTVSDSSSIPRVTFRATLPGVAGNAVTLTLVGGPTGAADASAIVVSGTAITVSTVKGDNTTSRTWLDLVSLFATYPVTITGAGTIICTGVTNADLTGQVTSHSATAFSGGAAATSKSYADRFLVTTSRLQSLASIDGLGLTGGATTPSGSNVGGSAVGLSGYLGQTYIDPVTDLKFTLVDPASALSYGYTQLPSPRYVFAPGDTITFVVSSEAAHVTGSIPTVAVPGLQLQVVTTLNMNPGDTAIVSTFNKAGKSPDVGDFYYVTYTVAKAASDFGVQLFTDPKVAYAAYGQPSSIANRLAIAISLLTKNGANQFACIQVPKQTGMELASDQSFIDAIQTLTKAFPGTSRKAGLIIPLSTSATVAQFLSTFLEKQEQPRNKGEAQGFIGFDQFATAATIAAAARAIGYQRVVAVIPNYIGYNIQGPTDKVAIEYGLDGPFVAAQLAGLALAPGNDVATTLTGQKVVGATRSLVTFDEPTLNQLAAAGVTCLVDVPGALVVRHYKTTDPSNSLTSEPYVTTTADYINQSFRLSLQQFVGRKETDDLENSIRAVLNGSLTSWNGSIISGYKELTVTQDALDPTTYDITVPIRPMFSVLYLNVTLQVSLS